MWEQFLYLAERKKKLMPLQFLQIPIRAQKLENGIGQRIKCFTTDDPTQIQLADLSSVY